MLFVEWCFQFVLLGSVLVGINCLAFWKELIIEDSFPVPLYIQHHLLWMKTKVGVGSFCLPHDLFHSILLYSTHFSLPVIICFFFKFFFICGGFCHTLKWNSHGFTCVPHPDPLSHLPLHPLPLGFPSAPGLSACLMHPTWAGDLFHLR